jgi:hypothetical protein
MEMETWKNGEIDMKTWNMEKWRRETWRHRDIETWTWRQGDIKRKKQKLVQFSLICLQFAPRANGSLSFVCLLTKKQTEFIRLQMD